MGPPGSRGLSGDIGPEVCTLHVTVFQTPLHNCKTSRFAFSGKSSSVYEARRVLVLDVTHRK